MLHLRADPPKALANIPVIATSDLLDGSLSAPGSYKMGGSTDVVTLYLSDDRRTRVTVRPSGTEPKLKVYVQHRAAVEGGNLAAAKARVDAVADRLGEAILEHCRNGLTGALRADWDSSTRRIV